MVIFCILHLLSKVKSNSQHCGIRLNTIAYVKQYVKDSWSSNLVGLAYIFHSPVTFYLQYNNYY